MPLQSLINSKRKNKVEFQVRLQNGRCRSLDLMQVADAGRQSHKSDSIPKVLRFNFIAEVSIISAMRSILENAVKCRYKNEMRKIEL